jgi:hypothetical protein
MGVFESFAAFRRVLLSALAASLLVAGTAQGADFTSGTPLGMINGHEVTQQKFNIQGNLAYCNDFFSESPYNGPSELLFVEPQYTGNCSAFGFTGASINPNDCEFEYVVGAGWKGTYAGTMRIACPPGKNIVISGGTCTVRIPPQTPTTNSITLQNDTSSSRVLVTFNVEGIHSHVTSGFFCPLAAKETDTSGKLTGSHDLAALGGVDIG